MAILNVIFVCALPRLLCGLLTMAKRVKHFLQMNYNDGGFAKQVLHFITACFVDLRGRLFLMKQNLNFDKAKRKNLNKMMIKCKRFTRKNLSKKRR